MNIEYKDFIGIYENVYEEGFCEHLITQFDRARENGAGINRLHSEGVAAHFKNDISMNGYNLSSHNENVEGFKGQNIVTLFFDGLQKCYNNYCGKFSILTERNLNATSMKMQKTRPGGGYHIWHAEKDKQELSRCLVYMLYLNTLDIDSAGETEFLYQKLRIPPKENTLIIWPADFTHVHRGNVVHGTKSKYVITGWFYYD